MDDFPPKEFPFARTFMCECDAFEKRIFFFFQITVVTDCKF